jgi:hypothetical protein
MVACGTELPGSCGSAEGNSGFGGSGCVGSGNVGGAGSGGWFPGSLMDWVATIFMAGLCTSGRPSSVPLRRLGVIFMRCIREKERRQSPCDTCNPEVTTHHDLTTGLSDGALRGRIRTVESRRFDPLAPQLAQKGHQKGDARSCDDVVLAGGACAVPAASHYFTLNSINSGDSGRLRLQQSRPCRH